MWKWGPDTVFKFFPFLLLAGCFFSAFGQVAEKTVPKGQQNTFGLTFHYGWLLKHNPVFPEIRHRPKAMTMLWGRATLGKKSWQSFYNFPETGLLLTFSSLGNDDVLGRSAAFAPYLRFYSKKNPRWQSDILLSSGWAFISKRYHPDSNPENNLVGSRFSNFIQLGFGLSVVLSPNWDIGPQFSILHWSNGNVRHPNLGINTFNSSLNFRYRPKGRPANFEKTERPASPKHWFVSLRPGFGLTETIGKRGPVSYIYLGQISVQKQLSSFNRVSVGGEYVFHSGMHDFMKKQELFPGEEFWKSSRFIMFLGHEFLFGDFGFVTHIGTYLNRPFLLPNLIHVKMGTNYYFWRQKDGFQQLWFGLYLKSYAGEAAYMETGIGYMF